MIKNYLMYGLIMGILLLTLRIIHYRTLIWEIRLEIFGLVIAIIFLGLGIWAGVRIFRYNQKRIHHTIQINSVKLSEREQDVLVLMADGLSNQEIADALFISLNTTKTHVSNIYHKLQVKRRTQALQKARELSLLKTQTSLT